jgi:hypothetical protein
MAHHVYRNQVVQRDNRSVNQLPKQLQPTS